MDVTTETLQAFLDDAWDAAPETASSLREQLRSFEKSITPIFSQGSIGSVSKNSASQTYRGPGLGSYTPIQIANSWRVLINLYDYVVQYAAQAYAMKWKWFLTKYPAYPADDNDTTYYSMMKFNLFNITEYQCDLTDLRIQPTMFEGTQVW